jgi:hypothetical protein
MITDVNQEFGEFQSIMLNLLVRSKIFGAQECLLIDKEPDQLVIQSIAQGYLLAQIADLRKFFDPNRRGQSYDLSAIIALTLDQKVQKRYDEIKATWEHEYKDIADKVFFHLDKSYTAPSGKDRHAIEKFIDELNEFLDTMTSSLTAAGYSIAHLMKDRNGAFLMEVESDAIATFRLMA